MKFLKNLILFFSLILVCLFTISCNGKKKEQNEELNLSMKDSITCYVGDTIKLDITYNKNVETSFDYLSNNTKICTFNDGTITCLAEGITTITLFENNTNTELNCKVIVLPLTQTTISSLAIDIPDKVYIGYKKELKAIYDENYIVDLEWKVSNTVDDKEIAKIEGNYLNFIDEGMIKVDLVDKISGIEVSKNIRIKDFTLIKKLELTGNETVETGSMTTFKAVYNELCDVDLEWTTSDNKVATVTNGLIHGESDGTCVITCKDKLSSISCSKTIIVGIGKKLSAEAILDWAVEKVGTTGFEYIDLPEKYSTSNAKITWACDKDDIIDVETGDIFFTEFNENCKLTCNVEYDGENSSRTFDYKVYGTCFYDVYTQFISQFKANQITRSLTDLVTDYSGYGGTEVVWTSSNTDVFTNSGILNKPMEATTITIDFNINLTDPAISESFSIDLKVMGIDIQEKANYIEEWILRNIATDNKLTKDLVLPERNDEYCVDIAWYDEEGNYLTGDRKILNPITDIGINSKIIITDNQGGKVELRKYFMIDYTYTEEDMWKSIELFIDTIANTKCHNQAYGGKEITAYYDNGYIPFYDENNLEITQSILPYKYGNCRTGIKKTKTDYIVVHDTGGSGEGADEDYHLRYITSINDNPNESSKSWHFTVGDEKCYQHLPLDEVGWHAGDGGHTTGDIYYNSTYNATSIGGGNYNGIGIESCINKGADYAYTMRRLAKLVAELLIEFDLDFSAIKQHNDFSGKNCPWIMRYTNRWNEFLNLVKIEYFGKTQLKGVKFEWIPIHESLDNKGRLQKILKNGEIIEFKVKVTYNGETREFTKSSTYIK